VAFLFCLVCDQPPLDLEGMPINLKGLMDFCLKEKPEKRLSFRDITLFLDSIKEADFNDADSESSFSFFFWVSDWDD